MLKNIILFILFITTTDIQAQTHALLVGVSRHQEACDPSSPMQSGCITNLEGPEHDVATLQQLLEQNGVDKKAIKSLVNEQATKKNILTAIDDLQHSSKEGDSIVLYFSGHGTSARDSDMGAALALPDTSGALIPFDATVRGNDLKKIANSLIIGAYDLRPRLSKLDSGNRRIVAIFDACYSASAVRALGQSSRFASRHIELPSLALEQNQADSQTRGIGIVSTAEKRFGSTIYPYQNLVYFSAAGIHETAKDIRRADLVFFPTLDGKPHGAFSNALFRTLKQPQNADRNRDGKTDLMELFTQVSTSLRSEGFPQTPQRLPSEGPALSRLFRNGLLNTATTVNNSEKPVQTKPRSGSLFNPDQNILRVSAIALRNNTLEWLSINKNISLTDKSFDVSVAETGDQLTWYDPSGVALENTPATYEAIEKRVQLELWKKHVSLPADTDWPLVLSVSLKGNGVGSTVKNSEKLGLNFWADKQVNLVVFSINSKGQHTLLFPLSNKEMVALAANTSHTLFDNIDVTPPYGVEQVVALTFKSNNPFINITRKLFNDGEKTVEFDSAEFKEWQSALDAQRGQFARAVQMIYTTE